MDISEIKTSLSKDLLELGYHLYSIDYKKKEKRLEILIDESLDLNEITALSEKVSALMDKYDEEFDEYLLDVASAGCEREIKTSEDITKAVNNYVHIKTSDLEVDGTIKSFVDGIIEIEYLDKTRTKNIKVNVNDVKNLRYAVKF